MAHKVLQNCEWGSLHVYVAPIDPAVRRSQSCAEEPITCLSHRLSSSRLRGKAVPALDILIDLLAEILLHDGDLSKLLCRVLIGLQLFQKLRE